MIPANMIHLPNIGPMLGQRRRRWTNIGPVLGECLVFAGLELKPNNIEFGFLYH